MIERVGTCSLCGGDVMGVRGAYWSVVPPGPDECSSCGAVSGADVIQMVPRPKRNQHVTTTTATVTVTSCPSCGFWPCRQTMTGCPLPERSSFICGTTATA